MMDDTWTPTWHNLCANRRTMAQTAVNFDFILWCEAGLDAQFASIAHKNPVDGTPLSDFEQYMALTWVHEL